MLARIQIGNCSGSVMELTTLKGIYVLIIQLTEDTEADVGSLGRISFKQGLYAYVGSAQNNLEKRIKWHLRKEKCRFWHIDYLLGLKSAQIVQVLYKSAKKNEECITAGTINAKGLPIYGFGSSDCRCHSHLFRLNNYDFLKNFRNLKLGSQF